MYFLPIYGEEVDITEVGGSVTPAAQLIQRVHAVSTLEFANAVGYYVVREFFAKDEQKADNEIEDLKRVLEEGFKRRAANEKHLGEKHIAKLKAENEEALAGATKTLKREIYTFVTRYVVEGDKYRLEKTRVSDTESLEKIRQDVLAGLIDLSRPNIVAWNGNLTTEIVSSLSDDNKDADRRHTNVQYTKITSNPDFMDFGRDMKDAQFFDPFVEMGLPMSTAAVTINGEQAEILRLGDKKSITFSLETCVLPSKGYVITFSRVRSRGMVMVEDYYRDFVQINDGRWLPTHIARTGYKTNQHGVPYTATRKELLAIDPPKVNVELPKNVFDLSNTQEFQSLPPLFRNPKTEPEEFAVTVKNRWTVFTWLLLQISLISIIVWLWLKSRRK
ncbi:hypothetical protein FACS1894189_4380 [Planctomycetales bacterium]|nr:hypothetical protein FACS1894189_4380 [Planctomycetales bacterium]